MFTGFVEEDFKAFAKYKAGSNEYNVERKTVWNKMKVLMNEINHRLYQNRNIYVRPYRVSPYWPSVRKKGSSLYLASLRTSKSGWETRLHVPNISTYKFRNIL
jgi:hypothetical protein